MTDERFLEELLEAVTVSGFEEEGQAVVRSIWSRWPMNCERMKSGTRYAS